MTSVARGCLLPLRHTSGNTLRPSILSSSSAVDTVRTSTRCTQSLFGASRAGDYSQLLTQRKDTVLCSREHFSTMAESQSWWAPLNSSKDEELEATDLEFKPMDEEQIPLDDEKLLTRRIHMLGVGSIGTLVAHSLKCLPNPPPITLLMHRSSMYADFKQGDRILRLVNKKTDINDEQSGFDVDLMEQKNGSDYWRFIADQPDGKQSEPTNPLREDEKLDTGEVFIYTLIVTVKGPATVNALKSIRHRVDSRSTILLMQNGLGQIDALNKQVFTDPAKRPTYMIGIISHGAYMQGPFAVVHAGFGTVALGVSRDKDKFPLPLRDASNKAADMSEEERKKLYPTDRDLYSNLSARYLLRTLTRSPILACAPFPYLDVFQLQLEKLVMNCILNPLTALLDVQNGYMLNNENLTHAQRLMIAEISMVLRGLPELEGVPNVRLRFSPKRLEGLCKAIAKKTAANSSSMREDVRHSKNTEIDYLNGYIVRRGEEEGIKCVLNYLICELIKGKTESQFEYSRAEGRDKKTPPYGTANVQADINPQEFGQSNSGVTLEDRGTPQG